MLFFSLLHLTLLLIFPAPHPSCQCLIIGSCLYKFPIVPVIKIMFPFKRQALIFTEILFEDFPIFRRVYPLFPSCLCILVLFRIDLYLPELVIFPKL